MNLELISNMLIALLIYNIILKAISGVIISSILNNTKTGSEVKKTYKELLEEKLKNK